jgi:mRNA-degrading endonuclease RelE of RelBE toxin-antitoxin system
MRWSAELSEEAQKQLTRFPRNVRDRIERAIDEFETKDDSRWSNIKALKGSERKGRYRKRVGAYRIIFRKDLERGVLKFLRSSSDPKTRIDSRASPIFTRHL